MKIGYRTVPFADRPLDDALETIAAAGYAAVELCLEHPELDPLKLTADRARGIRRTIDQLGLELAAVSYLGLEDQLEVRRRRTYAAIERLPDLGAKLFIVGSRREEPARLPAQWEEAIQLYRELADRCAAYGARLAVRPQPGLVVRSSEDLVKLIRECGHPQVAATLDIAHASLTADDLSWAVYQLGSRLAHVQVADVVGREHRHLLPGEGEIDFEEVREILEGVGYPGPLVISIPHSDGDPALICRNALAAYQANWAA